MTIPTQKRTKPFQLATAYTIGSYILPGYYTEKLNNYFQFKVKINVSSCRNIIDGIKNKKYDLGIIETPLFDNELIYHKWIENELVFCSNVELPPELDKDFLKKCTLICRESSSEIRKLIETFFKSFGITYDTFKRLKEIDHATAAIQSVKWSKKNQEAPTLTITSALAIEEEIKRKNLFISRLKGFKMSHPYYIVYPKQNKDTYQYENIVYYLNNQFINH